jgi:7-cyano-7-deazaguanine tRNA-ribosyltransferase
LSFEVGDRDLAGRIGVLHTRRGDVETPYLMPVVNPVRNNIPPQELKEQFGFPMIITNSYLILKHFGREKPDVHKLTGFDGIVMTDSGAYQLLIYGGVETNPKEIVQYQESIKSDLGVILDVPTGGYATREEAEATVEETIKRAKASVGWRRDDSMLWAGPVQGGRHLDLIRRSAKAMGRMDFDTHPLGSPVQVMEEYDYSPLVDMIVAAKQNLPPERPLHLFGAGHPAMLALAVALGCDLFDSAAYALFAKDDRYMTPVRTLRLDEMSELPCSCQVCSRMSLEELSQLPKKEREVALSRHNLYSTQQELKTIKQSLRDGTLWELLEVRSRSHPRLFEGFRRLRRYSKYLEGEDPVAGRRLRGLFFFDQASRHRPEVARYRSRLRERYAKPAIKDVLVLIPYTSEKPFNRSKEYREASSALEGKGYHLCFYGRPFGVVPSELAQTYPLSQFESADDSPIGPGTIKDFIKGKGYRRVVIVSPGLRLRLKGASTVESVRDVAGVKA